jgi:hypothetical protein
VDGGNRHGVELEALRCRRPAVGQRHLLQRPLDPDLPHGRGTVRDLVVRVLQRLDCGRRDPVTVANQQPGRDFRVEEKPPQASGLKSLGTSSKSAATAPSRSPQISRSAPSLGRGPASRHARAPRGLRPPRRPRRAATAATSESSLHGRSFHWPDLGIWSTRLTWSANAVR